MSGVDDKEEELGYPSKALVRIVREVPDDVKSSLREFFRTLGVDVELDDDDHTHAVSATFPNGEEIYVTGGSLGAEIGCKFNSNLPKFVSNETMIRAIDKTIRKVAKLAALGYFEIPAPGGTSALSDTLSRAKFTDTSDEALVLRDVKAIAKIMGHTQGKRRSPKQKK